MSGPSHMHRPYASAPVLLNKPIPALYDEQGRFLGRDVEIVPLRTVGHGPPQEESPGQSSQRP